MRHIDIRTISHDSQRYATAGDFFTGKDGYEQIRVSYLPDWRHSMLICFHELAELILTKNNGVKEEDITAFDKAFKGEGEPGDDPQSPYFHEHQIATRFEKKLCKILGIRWKEYENAVNNLFKED